MIVATAEGDEYWHHHCSDYRNTLINVHRTLHAHLTFEISLGLLILHVPEAGYLVEIILLYKRCKNLVIILVS